jgi:hypothetical protein
MEVQMPFKPTYANVAASIALFLALGGAAYAATQLPKNSVGPKQIQKNAVTSAKIKSGAITPPKLSASTKRELTGAAGPTGPKGEPGPLVETLPSGKTERGVYAFAGTRPTGGFAPGTALTFPIPLAFSPAIHKIEIGGPSTADCPGSEEHPEAAQGNLCFYEGRNGGLVLDAEKKPAEGRLGVILFSEAAENANYEYYGTWAVTAP